MEDQLTAFRAFHPKIFRRVATQQRTDLRRHDIGDPIHWAPRISRIDPRLIGLQSSYVRRQTLREFFNEAGHRGHGPLGPRSPAPRKPDCLDQRRADHDAVRRSGDRRSAFGVSHTESDRHRKIGMALYPRHRRADVLGVGAAAPVTPVIET